MIFGRKRFYMSMAFLAAIVSSAFASSDALSPSEGDIAVDSNSAVDTHRWRHGSVDCTVNSDPEIEVYAHDESTFILRQNKCQTFEAPFIYVLVGSDKVLVLDTGDIENPAGSTLFETVRSALGKDVVASREILVIHSHSHGDHYRGDAQFEGQPNVNMVKPNAEAVRRFFDFKDWPEGQATVELGGRSLIILPTPGHQEEAITVYDPQTKWLLTGDTLYPGYVYVKNWEVYKQSIARLAHFSEGNGVVAVMGAHIEMTSEPREYYPVGTTFQPDEAALYLAPETLRALSEQLQKSEGKEELIFDTFIIKKMNFIQRTVSNLVRSIIQ
ncbi:MAG: hydroxyacylglutathione hydrolase [Halioglobus sp.]|jgi:glyoxylase-like metal-dependent hydrolase (beta-lactamase superfamily II)